MVLLAGYAAAAVVRALAVIVIDAACAALVVAAASMPGWSILRRIVRSDDAPHLPMSLLACSTVGLGLGIFSLAVLGLGLAGWLNRATGIALVALAAAIGIADNRRALMSPVRDRLESWLRAPARWGWMWLLVVPMLAAATLGATFPPGVLWGDEPHWYDVMEYHLQVPREWYQAGHVIALHHNVFSYFPFNVEMLYLLGMHLRGGPWAGMYLAQFLHLLLIVITVVSIYAVGHMLGGSRGGALAGVSAATVPWMPLLAPLAYDEGGLLLYGTLSIGWALLALRDPGRRIRWMALSGVMAGLACGVKLTAVPMLLLAVPAAVLIVTLLNGRDQSAASTSGDLPRFGGRGMKRWMVACAASLLLGLAVFGPWLLRTWAWSGNPVFPEAMSLLGRGDFTRVQVQRWNLAHAARPDQRTLAAHLAALRDEIALNWRFGYLLLPMGIVAAVLSLRRRESQFLLLLMAIFLAFWLLFTHMQGRFFVLSIPIAAMLLALVPWRAWGGVATALLIVQALIGWLGSPAGPSGELVGMQPRMLNFTAHGLTAMIGLSDYRLILDPAVVNVIDTGQNLALIGDAGAFRYPAPMSRLHYRTVFDVNVRDDDLVDAWMAGIPPDQRHNWWMWIAPSELQRFAQTYYRIPPPHGPLASRSAPVLIAPLSIPIPPPSDRSPTSGGTYR
jgi:hypothetical protein